MFLFITYAIMDVVSVFDNRTGLIALVVCFVVVVSNILLVF